MPRPAPRYPAPPSPARRRAPAPPSAASAEPGFSLIEIVVVVAIVALLIGIAIPAASALRQQAKVSTTRTTLEGALAVETELRAKRGGFVRSTNGALGTDAKGNTASNPNLGIEVIVAQATRDELAQKAVASLTLRDTDGDGVDEIVDAWGNPLDYYAGLSPNPIDAIDGISSPPPAGRFIPPRPNLPSSRTPVFVSAGPDGVFGTVDPDDNTRLDDAAEDDIWSIDTE